MLKLSCSYFQISHCNMLYLCIPFMFWWNVFADFYVVEECSSHARSIELQKKILICLIAFCNRLNLSGLAFYFRTFVLIILWSNWSGFWFSHADICLLNFFWNPSLLYFFVCQICSSKNVRTVNILIHYFFL